MIYIIDGTGPEKDDEYNREMANGFCKQLAIEAGGEYMRGPSLFGTETFDIAENMLEKLLEDHYANLNEKIYLAGHSRGGLR